MRNWALASVVGLVLVTLVACSSNETSGSAVPAGVDASTPPASSDSGTGGTDGASADGGSQPGDASTLECFDFSNDKNVPLALDGTFSKQSAMWRRPHDEPEVCPATALLPASAAEVPHVVYAFCNNDKVAHTYTFEMLAQKGPKGEPALDDPYLVLYSGVGIASDAKQCLAINDDIPDALNVKDSEITNLKVPAGGKITVVGTTVTFSPKDTTGQGYYVIVVSNVDP